MPKKKEKPESPLARIWKPSGEHELNDGLVAARMIPAGTRIILEQPALIFKASILTEEQTQDLEDDLGEEFDELEADIKAQLMALPNNYCVKDLGNQVWIDTPYSGVIRSNAIPLSPDPSNEKADCIGIFPIYLCKVNHSCRPNAMQNFNSKLNACALHAIEDIQPGDNITISYVPECKIDRAHLFRYFQINCYCSRCRVFSRDDEYEIEALYESNDNRKIITKKLKKLVKAADIAKDLEEEALGAAFKSARQLWELMARIENISDYRFGQFYFSMFLLVIADRGSSVGAVDIFAALAWDAFRTCEGADSPKIIEIMKIMQKKVIQAPRDGPQMTLAEWHEQINNSLVDLVHKNNEHGEEVVLSSLYRQEIWPEDDPFSIGGDSDDDSDDESDNGPVPGELINTCWSWFTKDVDSQASDTDKEDEDDEENGDAENDEDKPPARKRAKRNSGPRLKDFVISDNESGSGGSVWGIDDEELLARLQEKKKRKKAASRGRGRGRGRSRGRGRGTGTPRGTPSRRGRGTPRGRGRGTPRGRPRGRGRGTGRAGVQARQSEDADVAHTSNGGNIVYFDGDEEQNRVTQEGMEPMDVDEQNATTENTIEARSDGGDDEQNGGVPVNVEEMNVDEPNQDGIEAMDDGNETQHEHTIESEANDEEHAASPPARPGHRDEGDDGDEEREPAEDAKSDEFYDAEDTKIPDIVIDEVKSDDEVKSEDVAENGEEFGGVEVEHAEKMIVPEVIVAEEVVIVAEETVVVEAENADNNKTTEAENAS